MQPRIHTRPIPRLTPRRNPQTIIQELHRTPVRLLLITHLQRIRKLQQSLKPAAFAHHQIPQMRRQGRNKMKRIETLRKDLVKGCQRSRVVTPKKRIDQ